MMKIIKFPTPSLLWRSSEVELDDSSREFIKEFRSFYGTLKGKAVGLAAPQVGRSLRIFIAQGNLYINPVMGAMSKETYTATEGCLSLEDGKTYEVVRHERITLSWIDINGEEHDGVFSGFEAEVIQHEYDHLEGILINQ